MMRTIYFSTVPKQLWGAAIIETVLGSREETELHNHDFCELFFIKRGEVLHTLNGNPSVLRRGDFHLIVQSDCHCFRRYSEENASLVNVSFPAEFCREICGVEPLSREGTLDAAQMIVVEGLLEQLLALDLSPEESQRHKRALLISLLQTVLLSQTVRDAQTSARIPQWLSCALELLRQPQQLREGIPALIRACGRSQEHVTRQMRQYYGKTPSQIVNTLRIDYAQRLLASTRMSVLEISMAAGYESVSYFNRLFVKQVGMSPRAYRSGVRNAL